MSLRVKYNYIKLGFWPVDFYQCIIQDDSFISYGYSIERSKKMAKIKSYHEAVERLAFKKLKQSHGYTSTTGFASAKNINDAINYAKEELIERELLQVAWSTQSGWQPIFAKNFLNKVLIYILKSQGWGVSLFKIQSSCLKHQILCGIALNKKLGAVFDCSYGYSPLVEDKIINSLLRQIYFFNSSNNVSLEEKGSPQDHKAFYSNPNNLCAFDFLNQSFEKVKINLEFVNDIKMTTLIENNMPPVAIAINPNWKPFSWGKQSIYGINPYPHPLA